MYLDFYSLARAPFHITPDPEFLFLSASHRAALGALVCGMASRQGVITVCGEAGVGKTTLLHAYLTDVKRQELKTIFVANPELAFDALLRLIFGELGLTVTTDDPRELVRQLQQSLAAEADQGRHVVLIIDGAQAMPVETLIQLRLLGNLQDKTGQPLQVVLVGQPELQAQLQQDALRHLQQYIVARTTILPLTRQESLAYIQHRLAHVTQGTDPLFTPAALRRIVRYAKGIPREVNILCTNALLAGFTAQQKPITAALVQRASANFQGRGRVPVWQMGLASSAALALVGGLLWLAPWQVRHDAPIMAPQALSVQGSDRIAAETGETIAPAGSSQVPEGETKRAAYDAQIPALVPEQSGASGAAPAQSPPTDTPALQEPATRLETTRRTPAEDLDTKALDDLLVRLEPGDKTTSPTAPRSKVARRRGAKSLARASVRHGVPSFALSPRRSAHGPPGLAPEFRFFDDRDPRARNIVNDSAN